MQISAKLGQDLLDNQNKTLKQNVDSLMAQIDQLNQNFVQKTEEINRLTLQLNAVQNTGSEK